MVIDLKDSGLCLLNLAVDDIGPLGRKGNCEVQVGAKNFDILLLDLNQLEVADVPLKCIGQVNRLPLHHDPLLVGFHK